MKHTSEAGSKPPVTADGGKEPDFPWCSETVHEPCLKSEGRGRDKAVRRDGTGQHRTRRRLVVGWSSGGRCAAIKCDYTNI